MEATKKIEESMIKLYNKGYREGFDDSKISTLQILHFVSNGKVSLQDAIEAIKDLDYEK